VVSWPRPAAPAQNGSIGRHASDRCCRPRSTAVGVRPKLPHCRSCARAVPSNCWPWIEMGETAFATPAISSRHDVACARESSSTRSRRSALLQGAPEVRSRRGGARKLRGPRLRSPRASLTLRLESSETVAEGDVAGIGEETFFRREASFRARGSTPCSLGLVTVFSFTARDSWLSCSGWRSVPPVKRTGCARTSPADQIRWRTSRPKRS